MGYRELSRMEIVEVVRRLQAGESQRGIARATGLARETVKKYLAAAGKGVVADRATTGRGANRQAGATWVGSRGAAHLGWAGLDPVWWTVFLGR